jgi:exodeoxyribonuclease VII small subunit
MSKTNELTFEAGYERLTAIAERLNQEEVPVSEMCDLFAEGKGLEQALTGYLDTQSQRVEEIERGEGIQAFRIVAPAPDGGRVSPGDELGLDDHDFEPASPASPASPAPKATLAAGNEDLPF